MHMINHLLKFRTLKIIINSLNCHLERSQGSVYQKIILFYFLIFHVYQIRLWCETLIISSQMPVATWYDIIGEGTIADAILDRLVKFFIGCRNIQTIQIILIKGALLFYYIIHY